MNPRKFAFFGTPYVARDTLAKLIEHGFVPSLVITNPDAPRGRGHVMTSSETKALALEKGIPVLTPEKLDAAAIASIQQYGCAYAIVVAYGKIFPQALIDAFPLGAVNVHYSLLPKYRGASPVETALLKGEKVTGVTIQQMAFEMDAGDILAQEEVPIGSNETSKELKPRLIATGASLLVNLLHSFEQGEITPIPQDHTAATRAGKIKKEDGLLELGAPARENWNKYRAYAEWPGVYFFTAPPAGGRIKVTKARYEHGVFVIERVVPEGKSETDYIPGARAPK
jgi:methionyl-tRNA formyltransferase